MKKDNLKPLKDLLMKENKTRYPNLPEYARAIPKFKETTANDLTKSIIKFLQLSGWQAERISVTGRYIDNSKIVTDCIGRQRKIGTGKWIKPAMTVGTADISSIIKGRSVKIEIKMKDKQSIEQIEYQKQVERAGGIYIIVHNFDEFHEFYKNFINENPS